jgi:hypothetical protein
MELTKRMCEESSASILSSYNPGDALFQGLAQMMMKQRDETRISNYKTAVMLPIQQGGSLARATALHVACGRNDPSMVQCILQLDPSTLSSRDQDNVTPLMVAAISAAGRKNNMGFSLDQPVIDILLAAGADKNATNSDGLTAYGLFQSTLNEFTRMMRALCGQQPANTFIPGYAELQAKLKPSTGPTLADLTGGDSGKPGLIHYDDEVGGKKKKRSKRG